MKKINARMLKNRKGLALMLVIVAILFGLDVSSSQVNILTDIIEGFATTFTPNPYEYESGEVVRVVDGDTIIVEIDGEDFRVRLIGVDTPESVGKYESHPEKYGKEASDFTKKTLEGQHVFLEKDVSDTDQYDRILRYVWLDMPNANDVEVVESQMFNAILLIQGYANSMIIDPDDKYSELFGTLEQEAREREKGLWGIENEK